jgi:hypothetical protein
MPNTSKVTRLRTSQDGSDPPQAERRREDFRRLAEKRTNRAIESILLIGNLSNRHVYEYEEMEVRKIVKALRDAVTTVETRFSVPQTRAGTRFKL